VRGSRNAHELELWTNLFFLLPTAVARGALTPEQIDLPSRTDSILAELDRLSREEHRPSTALEARSQKLLVQLMLSRLHNQSETMDSLISDLKGVIEDSGSLIGYPLAPLAQILTELGDVPGDYPAYDELFETLASTAAQREGEVAGARILLTRGAQQLDAGRKYEAIRTLGRVLGRLYKHESRADEVRALYLCAQAYDQVGLHWAARGAMLSAASISTNEYWTNDRVNPQQALCYHALKWIELQLGRLPQLLAWHETDRAVRAVLADRGYRMERLADHDVDFSRTLAIVLLRTELWSLRELTILPDLLDDLDLFEASISLKYALGHEDDVPEELLRDRSGPNAKLDLFRSWRDHSAGQGFPMAPELSTGRTVTLKSNILGCQVSVHCSNEPPGVELGESLLAALESFLSTDPLVHMVAREPALTIDIRVSDFAESPFAFEILDRDGIPRVEIRYRAFNPNTLTPDQQVKLRNTVLEATSGIVVQVFHMEDPDHVLKQLLHEELAPQRALDFTTSFVVVGNVLGHEPKTKLSSWAREGARPFNLMRQAPWDQVDRDQAPQIEVNRQNSPADHKSRPPAELLDPETAGHHQMRTVSIIRESLWNDAKWSGTGFETYQDDAFPPTLIFLFNNH